MSNDHLGSEDHRPDYKVSPEQQWRYDRARFIVDIFTQPLVLSVLFLTAIAVSYWIAKLTGLV